jgi:hypothetical protein
MFSLGFSRETASCIKKRVKKEVFRSSKRFPQISKEKSHRKKKAIAISQEEWENFPMPPWGSWMLIPCKASIEMNLTASSYLKALNKINECICMKNPLPETKFEPPFKIPASFFIYGEPEFQNELKTTLANNQMFRWKIKRLIHGWRLSRLKQVNTEDPATCEPPVAPITLYDWDSRSKYTFEATTLHRDISTRLLHVSQWEALHPEPMPPRNMLTNLPLTLGQIHFAIEGLKRIGLSNWETLSYRTTQYSIDRFLMIYRSALKDSAIKRIFKKPDSDMCNELTHDFIEYIHEINRIPIITSDAWKWYIRTQPDDHFISILRGLCYEYYTYRSYDTERINRILAQAKRLILHPPVNVYNKWKSVRLKPSNVVLIPSLWGGEDITAAVYTLTDYIEGIEQYFE